MFPSRSTTSVSELTPSLLIRDIGTSYALSQAVYVVATLGLADLVAAEPKDSQELAAATRTHAQSLYRVMRLLTGAGIFAEREGGLFELTPAAEYLRSDVPGSMRRLIMLWGGDLYRAFGDLLHSVKTGAPAFDHTFGMGVFPYLTQNPQAGKVFNEALSDWVLQQHAAVAHPYDFSRFKTLVDVGGGHGALITAILKANPRLRGVLFDQASVIEGAKKNIEAAGLTDRCEAVGGNFFDSIAAGGEIYCSSLVIHDWDDARSLAILKNCHSAMREGGTLLLVEVLVGPSNTPDWGKISDVYMLAVTGGRERTVDEYSELFSDAGFRLTRTIATNSEMSLIEGVRL